MVSESLGKLMIGSLMSIGYESMTVEDKNILVTYISQTKNVAYTDITKEYILNMQKEIKIQELSERCENEILRGFKSPNGYTYRTNRDDQINMIGQKDLLDSNPNINVVHWKTEDVGYIAHTKEDWLSKVYFYGLNYRANNLMRYNTLKGMVVKADSELGVISINWDYTPVEEYGSILGFEQKFDDGLGVVEEQKPNQDAETIVENVESNQDNETIVDEPNQELEQGIEVEPNQEENQEEFAPNDLKGEEII